MEHALEADLVEPTVDVGFSSRRTDAPSQDVEEDVPQAFENLIDRMEQFEFALAETNERNEALMQLLLEKLDQPTVPTGADDSILERLGALEETIGKVGPVVETLGGSVGELLEETRKLTATVDNQLSAAEAKDTTLSDASDRLSALQTSLEDIKGNLPKSELATKEHLDQSIGGVVGALESLIGEDRSAGIAQNQAVLSEIVGIAEKIEDLCNRPEPVVDLGPQERSLAQFGSVLTETSAKFDALAETITAQTEDAANEGAQTDFLERLDQIAGQVDALPTAIEAAMSGLMRRDDLQGDLQDAVGDLSASVEAIGKMRSNVSTDAVLAQQRSFAHFQTANKATLDRLVLLVDGFGERCEALVGEIKTLHSAPEAPLAPEEGVLDAIQALATQVSELPKSVSSVPSSAFIAHQKSLTRFQTANAASVKRFESLNDALMGRLTGLEEQLNSLAELKEDDQTDHVAQFAEGFIGPLSDLAQANKVLASAQLPADDLLEQHDGFLSDLRVAVSECLALCLQNAANTQPTNPEMNS